MSIVFLVMRTSINGVLYDARHTKRAASADPGRCRFAVLPVFEARGALELQNATVIITDLEHEAAFDYGASMPFAALCV